MTRVKFPPYSVMRKMWPYLTDLIKKKFPVFTLCRVGRSFLFFILFVLLLVLSLWKWRGDRRNFHAFVWKSCMFIGFIDFWVCGICREKTVFKEPQVLAKHDYRIYVVVLFDAVYWSWHLVLIDSFNLCVFSPWPKTSNGFGSCMDLTNQDDWMNSEESLFYFSFFRDWMPSRML